MPEVAVTDLEYQTLARIRYTFRRFLSFSENAAREAGLTPQQHQAILAVRGNPRGRSSVGELAQQLQLKHHSAVELVERLEKLGLLERDSDPQDRRRVLLRVSERGETILARLSAVHREELRRLGPELRELLQVLG